MAEEKEGKKVVARRTQSSADWRSDLRRDDFDVYPSRDVREEILKRINPDSDLNFRWISEHIEAHLEIEDFETVLMLLRQFSQISYSRLQKEAMKLIVKSANAVLEYAEHSGYWEPLKEIVVVLCGKINFYEKVYDNSVRDIFERIINKYYPSWYGSSKEESRLISRILLPIAHVKDVHFLPILKAKEPSDEEFNYLMKYTSVCKDRIGLEALRLLAIKHLENCE